MAENVYRLPKGVKVRNEDFGLLFYLCQSTGLVFINSGKLLTAEALEIGGTAQELLGADNGNSDVLANLLAKLAARGLVEIC